MSSKTMLSAAVAVFAGATLMITGQAFAASTPAPTPGQSRPATTTPRATPAPAPTATPAQRAVPVRAKPRFTG